jgi:hypothetical protein
MRRGVISALVLLLVILAQSSTPAGAHSDSSSSAMAPYDYAKAVEAPLSYDYEQSGLDESPCPNADRMHGLMCCAACCCSGSIGWVSAAEPASPPAAQAILVYSVPPLSWPDGSGLLPALPPPRSVV